MGQERLGGGGHHRVAKVQKKLDTAKVKLAKQNERKAEAVKP